MLGTAPKYIYKGHDRLWMRELGRFEQITKWQRIHYRMM